MRVAEKARNNTSEHVFHKLTTSEDGKPRIIDEPPLLYHPDSSELDIEGEVLPFLKDYRETLPPERRALFDRFELVDVACKVVGVGSVGTRCYVALFAGNQDDHLFLQIKQARPSVLEGLAGPAPFPNNGERVVVGQRLMQSASDIFLGWTRSANGDAYVRQLRDMKVAPVLADFNPDLLTGLAVLCGRTLARAHAKAGDAATITGYLGGGTQFDEAIAQYAGAYANQVERDYELFKKTYPTGRFPVETIPSEVEAAIR
jgi:uncharacterized protein (DUF2252 family)